MPSVVSQIIGFPVFGLRHIMLAQLSSGQARATYASAINILQSKGSAQDTHGSDNRACSNTPRLSKLRLKWAQYSSGVGIMQQNIANQSWATPASSKPLSNSCTIFGLRGLQGF